MVVVPLLPLSPQDIPEGVRGAKAKCRIYPDYVIINVNMHC
jgi:hypothetical protein